MCSLHDRKEERHGSKEGAKEKSKNKGAKMKKGKREGGGKSGQATTIIIPLIKGYRKRREWSRQLLSL